MKHTLETLPGATDFGRSVNKHDPRSFIFHDEQPGDVNRVSHNKQTNSYDVHTREASATEIRVWRMCWVLRNEHYRNLLCDQIPGAACIIFVLWLLS